MQQAIANNGLYVLGYVAITTIKNRELFQRKTDKHTSKALAWRFRRDFRTEDRSQSQRLKYEQRRRRDRDDDDDCEQ